MQKRGSEFFVEAGTFVTPEAKIFAKSNDISIVEGSSVKSQKYIDHFTGKMLSEKPEDMTHIIGNRLVRKNDLRIAFRGQADKLQAYIVRLGALSVSKNRKLLEDLGELQAFVRKLMLAEIKQEPLPPPVLFGMDSEEIRIRSHKCDGRFESHPMPCASHGVVAAELNLLRTMARELELCAVNALPDRTDIIEHLNRLSSAVYILYIRAVAGEY